MYTLTTLHLVKQHVIVLKDSILRLDTNFDFTLSSEELDVILPRETITDIDIDEVLTLHIKRIVLQYDQFIRNGHYSLVRKCFVYLFENITDKRKNLTSYVIGEVC